MSSDMSSDMSTDMGDTVLLFTTEMVILLLLVRCWIYQKYGQNLGLLR